MDKSTPEMRHRSVHYAGMSGFKPAEMCFSTSRRALRTLSNGQPPINQGSSYSDDPGNESERTPTRQASRSYRHKLSVRSVGLSARRQLSKSHGDLSNLRPKSPPIYNLTAELQRFHVSPGNYGEDRETRFSPSDNGQSPQASPNDSQTNQTDTGFSGYKHLYSSLRPSVLGDCQPEATPTAIKIQRLTSGFLQPLDFCIPYVRSHPNHVKRQEKPIHNNTREGGNVEHLDISTTWNGLRDTEAQELFRIHQAFTTTLERMLAGELWQIYLQSLQQASPSAIHPLYTSGVVRGISFCRDQLVGEMADALYSSEAGMAKAQLGLLRLYLAANDCLVPYRRDDSRDTSITVRVYCDRKPSMPSPIVEAAWAPDTIMFKDLHESPCEGEEISIIPQYQSNSAFGATRFPTNVSYIISSAHHPLTWLNWNDEIAGFRGVVPVYSETPGNEGHFTSVARSYRGNLCTAVEKLCIEVKSILTDDNGSVVRYERVVRAHLTLNIVPWVVKESARKPSDLSTGPNRYQRTKSTSPDEPFKLLPAAHDYSLGNEVLRGQPFEDYLSTNRFSLPNHGPHTVDKGSHEHFVASLPVTIPAINAIKFSGLAQKHADLAAMYADLAQRHADAEKHVKLLVLPRDFGTTQMHRTDLQVYVTGPLDAPSFVNQPTERQRLANGSSTCSHTSGYTTDQNAAPPSPILRARDATQNPILESRLAPRAIALPPVNQSRHRPRVAALPTVNQPGNVGPQFTALPPPAFQLSPLQTFDEVSQTWDRVQTPQGTLLDQNHASATPVKSTEGEPSPSTFEKDSRKRRAGSSLSELSSPKRFRELGTQPSQKASTSMTRDEENGSAIFTLEETAQNLKFDLGNHTCIEETDDPFHRRHMAARSPFDLPTPDSLSNPSRATSQTMASNGSGSRVPSIELDVIVVEDPQIRKVSYREQAMLWSLHSPSVDSDKENQLETEAEEGRLGKDEKKTMDEAIERSIDDLVGKFDEVFLDGNADPSSGSSSGDDELEDLVNYGF